MGADLFETGAVWLFWGVDRQIVMLFVAVFVEKIGNSVGEFNYLSKFASAYKSNAL